jgi:hypothetical protein
VNFATRIQRFEQALGAAGGRTIMVVPLFGPDGEPGGIEPWPHDPRAVTLTVPAEHAGDPMGGLTDAQRAEIGDGDRVIVVSYTEDWKGVT